MRYTVKIASLFLGCMAVLSVVTGPSARAQASDELLAALNFASIDKYLNGVPSGCASSWFATACKRGESLVIEVPGATCSVFVGIHARAPSPQLFSDCPGTLVLPEKARRSYMSKVVRMFVDWIKALRTDPV